MTTQPTLRPLTIGDLLDAAFRLYRKHFVTFIGIVALLQVPMVIIQVVLQLTVYGGALTEILNFNRRPPAFTPGANPLAALPLAAFLTIYGISLVLGLVQYLVVYNLITGALSRAVAHSYLGQPVSILSSYRMGWRTFSSLVGASLLPYLASLIVLVPIFALFFAAIVGTTSQVETLPIWAIILLIIGLLVFSIGMFFLVMFVYVRFLIAPQAIVLEGQGPLQGLGRSWNLTKQAFWRTLLLIVLMGIVVYLVSGIPASVVSLAGQLLAPGVQGVLTATLIATLLSQVGLILALPLQFSVYTLLYYDQRVRREAYDLELQTQSAALV